MMTSVIALTIDAILPALDGISDDLAFESPSDRQLIVLIVFAGMGIGQPVFGPLADAIGRRRTAVLGWALYIVWRAGRDVRGRTLTGMLIGRLHAGRGCCGRTKRVVASAIVRDLYSGRPMAKILSLIMTIFMLVPMLAPLVGQGLEARRGLAGDLLAVSRHGRGLRHLAPVGDPRNPGAGARPPAEFPTLCWPRSVEVLRTKTTMFYTMGSASISSAHSLHFWPGRSRSMKRYISSADYVPGGFCGDWRSIRGGAVSPTAGLS